MELYKDLLETTIGEKIIRLRKMNNLEREELATILEFHVGTVIGWEVENVMPKPKSIKRLCKFYGVS